MDELKVELPSSLRRRLARAAQRQGRTDSDLIREAIERHLQDVADPLAEIIGAFDGPADGLGAGEVKRHLRERWRSELALDKDQG